MSHEIHFRCPVCGKSWRASFENGGRKGTCQHCGEPVRVPAPVARKANPGRDKVRALAIWVAPCLACVVVMAGWLGRYEAGRRARAVERANQAVAGEVDTARACLASGDWDRALALLEAALATEKATDLGEAEALLGRARQAKVDGLAAADRRRQEEVAAAARRRQEEALRRDERIRREREARVRATPLFRELRAFVEKTRLQLDRPARDNQALFAYLFEELNVNDPREQQRIRREASRLPDEKAALELSVAPMRAGLTERFRSLRQFDREDGAAFEKAVAEELDPLLEELKERTKE